MFKTMMTFAVIVLLAGNAGAATYTIDKSHSSVGFKVRHMMVSKVHGSFGDFEGSLEFVEGDPSAWAADVTIKTATVDTNDEGRDKHLRNEDFFNVDAFPEMTFKATGAKAVGDGFVVVGDLTLVGVTKPVELEVEYNGSITDPWGNVRVGFSAEAEIDRGDFGMKYNSVLDNGGVAVARR